MASVLTFLSSVGKSSLLWYTAAQQQVVAGIKYDLTLLVQPTQCDNIEANHVPDLETACPLDTSAEPKLVAATVLWQAWADPSYTVTIKKQ